MQRITTSFFSLVALCLLSTSLQAQTRFIDEIYDEVTVTADQEYSSNLSAINMFADALPQRADIYEAADDEAALRPVVVLWPTGNFLPAYINQGAYGTRVDSANVTMLKSLARRGYVGISADYRQGWLPTATSQDVRTGTLLQAAYRGAQDAHAMARWLRKLVVEEGNPYRIDTSRIVFWGFGTGGYVSMTHAFLDREEEILANDQFYDEDGNPLVNEAIISDPQGLAEATQHIVNHPGYSSDVAMSINTGGAIGDPNWIEGADNEPITIGHHSWSDPFAPFYEGTVIVPTTMQPVVSGVGGTRRIVELANMNGLNDAIAEANAVPLPDMFGPLATAVNAVNAAYSQFPTDLTILNQNDDVTGFISEDNMFPHVYATRLLTEPVNRFIAGPYNWFDNATLMAILSQFPPDLVPTFEELEGNEARTNPNYNMPEEAKLTIDTMLAHFIPRAWYGLNLEELTSTEELVQADAIGLTVAPNPASEYFLVSTESERILEASLFDINGREVATFGNVNNISLRVDRSNLPNGQYVLRIRVKQGIVTQKVTIH